MTKNLIVYSFIFLAGLAWNSTVHASVEYSVIPLVIDESVEARDIIARDITITNTGAQPVTVYPTVNNISVEEGGVIKEFLAPVESDRTTSLSSWIEIKRLGIDLKSGETKIVPVTFRIDPSPVPGTYHALIGFGNGRNRDEAEAQVKSGQAPSTLVTVTVEEKKNEFLKLSKFVVSRFVTREENAAATFVFKNPGDETLTPKGEIILYDNRGEEVGVIPVNQEDITIAPGGEYTFSAKVPVLGMFGKYKAFLSVDYGVRQRASIQDTDFFYVFPIKTLIIIFAVLGVFIIFVALYVHKKYLDDTRADGSDSLTVHIRDTESESNDHDINLKQMP